MGFVRTIVLFRTIFDPRRLGRPIKYNGNVYTRWLFNFSETTICRSATVVTVVVVIVIITWRPPGASRIITTATAVAPLVFIFFRSWPTYHDGQEAFFWRLVTFTAERVAYPIFVFSHSSSRSHRHA